MQSAYATAYCHCVYPVIVYLSTCIPKCIFMSSGNNIYIFFYFFNNFNNFPHRIKSALKFKNEYFINLPLKSSCVIQAWSIVIPRAYIKLHKWNFYQTEHFLWIISLLLSHSKWVLKFVLHFNFSPIDIYICFVLNFVRMTKFWLKSYRYICMYIWVESGALVIFFLLAKP